MSEAAIHPQPPTTSRCTGCGASRSEGIKAVAKGRAACCPDCSTLTVEDRNAIRECCVKAEPQGPTDEELLEIAAKSLGYYCIPKDDTNYLYAVAGELLVFARTVLARWGSVDSSQPPPDDA